MFERACVCVCLYNASFAGFLVRHYLAPAGECIFALNVIETDTTFMQIQRARALCWPILLAGGPFFTISWPSVLGLGWWMCSGEDYAKKGAFLTGTRSLLARGPLSKQRAS